MISILMISISWNKIYLEAKVSFYTVHLYWEGMVSKDSGQGKGQWFMDLFAITDYIGLATNQSKIYNK